MPARALSRPQRKLSTEQKVESPHWHAACGFIFLLIALFYFLALISYDPADLPAWAPWLPLSDTPTPLARNLIGRSGAVLAGYTFWMFGGANYVLPICFTWFGVCKLTSQMRITLRAWMGFALMVTSAAALLYLQTLWEWDAPQITPLGAGGGLGYVVGGMLLLGILGEVGSIISLGFAYLIGMIFVTGMHPIQVAVHILKSSRDQFVQYWINRRLKREAAERAALQPFNAPPADLSRGKGSASATGKRKDLIETQLDLPPVNPIPKIYDSTVPKTPKPKPLLAEVWQKRQEQKEQRAAFAKPQSLTSLFKNYVMPPLDILSWPPPTERDPADDSQLREMQNTIIRTLGTFDIKVTAGDITKGPAITRFEVYPSDGLRVNRIVNLEADLARATKAERLNILAPIPGKDTVGIELANREKIVVPIRELLEDDAFQSGKAKIPIALGKDVYGKAIIADLASMPHLLVAGATGSGKSVCINSIITSLLCRFAPDELRFIMIDPKFVEMQGYKDLPHLALPVVTDPKLSLLALRWVVNEMEKRYQVFAKEGCRNFDAFNARKRGGTITRAASAASAARSSTTSRLGAGAATAAVAIAPPISKSSPPPTTSNKRGRDTLPHPDKYDSSNVLDELDAEDGYSPGGFWEGNSEPPPRKEPELEVPDTFPYIVVIIDELADLMQTAPADIEGAIQRITQKARAAGIHMIVATQTPRADVVTGTIKANIPCRIAFQVSSALDSRVIMDRKGADKLVGKGDMLYLPPGTSQLIRAQGTMVTDDEIQQLVDFVCEQGQPVFEATLGDDSDNWDDDEDEGTTTPEDEAILEKVLDIISAEKKASTSLIQRRLRLGYTRAARMMDILEERGIIGPGEGAKPREILVEL
ncbi:DNA translocase FtsK [Phragmitibacter flavus]|uniref:DNA translocase FtsK n=1 Tax=Phragmitibacter flavus TaxID=2576071 RepID=A0A5R8KAN5_9BACT|nr:DNA translocase FtsK [Phragmitibacter flavus]TLD69361.1 DNA translocase FtsK [Phragmitibacter flavus]